MENNPIVSTGQESKSTYYNEVLAKKDTSQNNG